MHVCLEVEGRMEEGLRKSRNKPGLVVMNPAGHGPSQITCTVPSSSKTPESGLGGNGGTEKTVSGGTGRVPGRSLVLVRDRVSA